MYAILKGAPSMFICYQANDTNGTSDPSASKIAHFLYISERC